MRDSTKGKKTRILIVDDSAVMRSLLLALFASESDFEVVGTASDALSAREKIVRLNPDVMTLDISMPGMDGISFLAKVMQYFPVRTLVLSGSAHLNNDLGVKALEAGALDVVLKADFINFPEAAKDLCSRLRKVARIRLPPPPLQKILNKLPLPAKGPLRMIAIAASTGGTEALKKVLRELDGNVPPIVIVQHMPANFTGTFARSLDAICSFDVREAKDGDVPTPGLALLAPGDFHMELVGKRDAGLVRLNQAPPLHGVRPAADILFNSVARVVGKGSVGLILTGMGKDGAEGLLAMKKSGALTGVQDEASCVVYGMPKAAVEIGAADCMMPLDVIGTWLRSQYLR